MDILKVANLARLELTDAEIEEYGGQLDQILKHIEQLNAIDVEGIEPTAHAAPVFDVYREDEEQPDRTLSQEAVLKNAPATAHEQIKMPKVIE
ncbi:MAG: Asp-tRNA(Asn)/Glu-tRNA(Gln) amidotransferase subunit GatC [Verrucomicrobiales bacterium]|nr:Asp-tRNA(Asn)/Glu-tRNA(Gln) amidotransferase subunit GatC [Verrucomicrobiales bacterium]